MSEEKRIINREEHARVMENLRGDAPPARPRPARRAKTAAKTKQRAPRKALVDRLISAIESTPSKKGNGAPYYLTEHEYLKQVVQKSLTDPKLMMQVLQRLVPPPKSQAPTVAFAFPENGNPVQKMEAVLHAVVRGEVSPDVGITITAMIKQTSDVAEVTEMMERLQRLEEQIRQQAIDKNGGKANG